MGKLQEYDALTGAEANDKNIYRVDKYVSGTEGVSGVYETKRVTEGKLKEVLGIDAIDLKSTRSLNYSDPFLYYGRAFNISTQSMVNSANYKITDFICIKGSDRIEVVGGWETDFVKPVTFFDKEFNYIGYYSPNLGIQQRIDFIFSKSDIPSGAFYALFTSRIQFIDSVIYGVSSTSVNHDLQKLRSALECVGTLNVNTRDLKTFIGSNNFIIDQLLTVKPKARIAFVTHYSYSKHNSSLLLTNLVKAQKALADYWNAPLVNLADTTGWINKDGINIINDKTSTSDKLHPAADYDSQTGRSYSVDVLAGICASQLEKIFLDWTGKKVAWYGTSIPAGHPNESIENCQYPKLAVNKLGGTCDNYSVSSSVIRDKKADGSPVTVTRDRFSDSTSSLPKRNYINSMLDLIGTPDEPDLFVFDFGYNDFAEDESDFNSYKYC